MNSSSSLQHLPELRFCWSERGVAEAPGCPVELSTSLQSQWHLLGHKHPRCCPQPRDHHLTAWMLPHHPVFFPPAKQAHHLGVSIARSPRPVPTHR